MSWFDSLSLNDRFLIGGFSVLWSVVMFLIFRQSSDSGMDSDSDDDGGVGEEQFEEIPRIQFQLPTGKWLSPQREALEGDLSEEEVELSEDEKDLRGNHFLEEDEAPTPPKISWVYEPPVTRSQTQRRRRRLYD